jgi:hypothetical protein
MDADQTCSFNLLKELWDAHDAADVVVASRYTYGGQAKIPILRKTLSRILNVVFSRGLDLPLHDMSSGFRLYISPEYVDLALERVQPYISDTEFAAATRQPK